VLFGAMSLIWGIPYLLIRVAVRDLSPADVVFLRTGLGALLLAPLVLRRGEWRGIRAHWRALAVYTVIEVTVPWWLLTAAEQHLSSALAGLLIAPTPMFGALIGRAVGGEARLGGQRLTGLLLGAGGVVALVGLQVGHVDAVAMGAVLLTAACYATGPFILSHRLSDAPATGVVFVSLAASAVVWAAPAVTSWPAHVGARPLAAVVLLAVVCTATAFLVFLALIGEAGPSRATVITYVNPAVAVVLGVAVLGEHFTRGMAVGFPLVIVGSVLATQRAPAEH
jgi:drug/metabolite transporter (DMT)-like permease